MATEMAQGTLPNRNPTVLYLAFELSQKQWKLGFTIGMGQTPRIRTIPARDLDTLQWEIQLARQRFHIPESAPVSRAGAWDTDTWRCIPFQGVERTWSSLRRFDAVIPTGGDAVVLGELLRSALAAKGAAVHWPADPVTANVIGFYKWGCRVHRYEVLR